MATQGRSAKAIDRISGGEPNDRVKGMTGVIHTNLNSRVFDAKVPSEGLSDQRLPAVSRYDRRRNRRVQIRSTL